MKVLHLSLKSLTTELVKLKAWDQEPADYEDEVLSLAEIEDLIQQSELDYYVLQPQLKSFGQRLFIWLDGDKRWLSRSIQNCQSKGIVLAIDVEAKLAHLPWEVLHDGQEFLIQKIYPLVTPVRWVNQPLEVQVPQNRPLHVLFMATSPEDVQPVLNFEEEEAEILRVTKDLPLTLRVEESGCVSELNNLWRRYATDTFDVFHLTGHADHQREEPYTPFFITESLTGERQDTTAMDLLNVFRLRQPRLIFLSGCRTGESVQKGDIPSLAETLVHQGMPAVMGWGRPVLDSSATQAAALLYEHLAAGMELVQALALTLQALIKKKVNGWHLLRLYVRGEAWGALVDPPGFYQPLSEPVQYQFLDYAQQVRVATPEQFVGRRRVLQWTLQALKKVRTLGLYLYGLGGVGKSTVAARILERLPDYKPIVLYRDLDAPKLQSLLQRQCTSEIGHQILNSDLPFMQKLTAFFNKGLNNLQQPLMLVLDDFEANLEHRGDGRQVMKAEVVESFTALMQALAQSQVNHRLLITSRYDVILPICNDRLDRMPLASLRSADLQKKYDRLASFSPNTTVNQALQREAQTLADGNPRLLEWLDRILQDPMLEPTTILSAMTSKTSEFREDILAETLLEQQPEDLKQLLTRMQVFELPVSYSVVAAVCSQIKEVETHCRRATTLGLLECTQTTSESLYRLPRILVSLLSDVLDPVWYKWGLEELLHITENEPFNEEKALEIFRLAGLAQKEILQDKVGWGLGVLWYHQGRYQEAELMHEQILAMRRKRFGDEHEDVADSINNLAGIYQDTGRYQEAEQFYIQALKLTQKLLGPNHKDVADRINNLAQNFSDQGRYKEAESLFKKSLNMTKMLFGSEHYNVAIRLNNLAQVYNDQGFYEKAEPLFIEAIKLIQKTVGFKDIGLAKSVSNLAGLYDNQGRYQEAEQLYIQALKMNKNLLGSEHPNIAIRLNDLAFIYNRQGRYKEAEQLYIQALKLKKKIYGPENPNVATGLDNLASNYQNQGYYEQAEPLYIQALQMKKRFLGAEHPEVALCLDNLASLYSAQGRYEEAEPLHIQALQITQDLLGKGHQDVGICQGNLGHLYQQQGKYKDAEVFYRKALQNFEANFGTNHHFSQAIRKCLNSLP